MPRLRSLGPLTVLAAALASAPACEQKREPKAAAAADGPSCEQRVTDMREAFAPLLAHDRLAARIGPVDLVAGTGEAVEPDAVVTISDTLLRLDDRELAANPVGASLGAALAQQQPKTIALAIDGDTSWPRVVKAVGAVVDSGATPWVLVAGPIDPEIAALPFARKVEAAAPDEGLALAVETTRGYARDCEAVLGLFNRLTSVDSHEPMRILTELPAAVEGCRCEVDVEGLRDAMRVMLTPSAWVVALALDPQAPGAAVLRHGAETRWASVANELLERAPAVRPELNAGESEPMPPPPLAEDPAAPVAADPLAPELPRGPEPGSREADAELADLLANSELTQDEFEQAFRGAKAPTGDDLSPFGPGTRKRSVVTVGSVKVPSGKLDPARAKSLAAGSREQFERCHAMALSQDGRQDGRLDGGATGSLTLRVRFDGEGRVAKANSQGGSALGSSLRRCLVSVAEGWQLAEAANAEISLALSLGSE